MQNTAARGCVGIIEKQFAGEVYGGKVVHLTKPTKKKKRANRQLEVLEKTCLTEVRKKKEKKPFSHLPALFRMHIWLKLPLALRHIAVRVHVVRGHCWSAFNMLWDWLVGSKQVIGKAQAAGGNSVATHQFPTLCFGAGRFQAYKVLVEDA